MTIRRLLRGAASTRMAASVATPLERIGSERACAILTYHRITDPDASTSVYPNLCVRPEELEAQLQALSRRHEVISLGDLLAARRGERRLPRRSVLLTFDDAYGDFATHAWPIVAAMSLPATLFVPTGFPDQPGRAFWWDRLFELLVHAAPLGEVETPIGPVAVHDSGARRDSFRRLRSHAKSLGDRAVPGLVGALEAITAAPPPRSEALPWAELRRLGEAGVALAPHSRTHRLLPGLDDAELRHELEQPRADLVREIGQAPAAIAYPSGAYDGRVLGFARDAGYELGFTTRRGVLRGKPADWLALPRINVGLGTSPSLLATQLAVLAALGRRRTH